MGSMKLIRMGIMNLTQIKKYIMNKLLIILGFVIVSYSSYGQLRPQAAIAAGDTTDQMTDTTWLRSYSIGADNSTEYIRPKPFLDAKVDLVNFELDSFSIETIDGVEVIVPFVGADTGMVYIAYEYRSTGASTINIQTGTSYTALFSDRNTANIYMNNAGADTVFLQRWLLPDGRLVIFLT